MRNKFMKLGITTVALCLSQMAFADGVYTIYPVPQQQVSVAGSAKLTPKVNVILETGIDAATKQRLIDVLQQQHIEATFSEAPDASMSNIYLGIAGSGEQADQFATAQQLKRDVFTKVHKFDRHCVSLSAEGGLAQVLILGENTDATFFGIASLEQMLERDHAALPCIQIYDYADQQSRGIVEGYYGYPYSVEVKADLMRFMMRHKMNTYLYGAKSDPYHSGFWKKAYPTTLTADQVKKGWLSQDMVRDLAKESHDTKVNFIWAIHPGNDIMNSNTVVNDVMNKFNMMYKLGVRQFAVFVDDVGVPNDDATMNRSAANVDAIQEALEKKYNKNYTAATDTVRPLHFVPQVYCSSWVKEDQRKRFFASLKKNLRDYITVYTTGWGVWSVPNQGDFDLTARELGRPAAWWWNYPCNDNADAQIYPMDMYSNFFDMPSVNDNATVPKSLNNSQGIVSNPMQQGEISKIPIFSVADFAWNTSGFNNTKSWNAAFPAIVGKDKAAALQLIAKYIRWNDPDELNGMINTFKNTLQNGRPNSAKLQVTLDEVYQACLVVEGLKDSETESDRLLYNDLAPWLLKVKQLCASTIDLLKVAEEKDADQKWGSYIAQHVPVVSLDSAERYKVYSLEGMGENPPVGVRQSAPSRRYLHPFTKYLHDNVLGNYFKAQPKEELRFVTNRKDLKGKATLAGDTVSLNNGVFTLQSGDYVGFALPHPRKVADVVLSDTLLAHHRVLYSSNGKVWTNYSDKAALLDGYVKYFCVKNEGAKAVSLQLPANAFGLFLGDPVAVEQVKLPNGPIWNDNGYVHDGSLMFDGDYTTFTCLKRNQQHGDIYTLELTKMAPIHDVRVCMGITNGDHMNKGQVEISKDGKSWKAINVKGTSTNIFTIDMGQCVPVNNDMKYCDFDGKGAEAKYVRFVVKEGRTDKWLRFYEMEVNKKFYNPAGTITIPSGNIWQNHTKELICDGNPLTFVCLNKTQVQGDTYTVTLKEPTLLKDVRVFMGDTNGDHMNKGNVEVFDGKSWKRLLVKGTDTYDFTMDMPQTVHYYNEVHYCDFEGYPSPVKKVRFVVKDARTDKWLRLYEIAFNQSTQNYLSECVDGNGTPITTLNDASGQTGIQDVPQSITYHFNSLQLMKSVAIYSDIQSASGAQVKVTSDGTEWKSYGELAQSKQVIDLSDQSDAIAMKIEWKGSKSPAIYEIVPELDDAHFSEVTKVEQVTDTEAAVSVSFRGKTLYLAAATGISQVDLFTMEGKALVNYQAAGSHQVTLPVMGMSGQTYLVRVQLANGSTTTYKVFCK